MRQPGKKTAAAAGAAAALTLAAALIAGFEGKRNVPYKDPVGILTVCYGHTGKDIEQRRYSDAQCLALLQKDIERHAPALSCIKQPLQLHEQAALASFAYNVGSAAFCGSTLAKKANAGDMAGACAQLSRWTRAGGRVLPGLVRRRAAERALCEGNFEQAARVLREWGMSAAADAVQEAQQESAGGGV